MTRKSLFLRALWSLTLISSFISVRANEPNKRADSFAFSATKNRASLECLLSKTTSMSTKPGVVIKAVEKKGGKVVNEWGKKISFEITLATKPTDNVLISLESSDETEAKLKTSRIFFKPSEWNVPQRIELEGVDDKEDDDAVTFEIITTVESGDPDYDKIAVNRVAIINDDNDFAPIIVTNDGNDLVTMHEENGELELIDIDATDDLNFEGNEHRWVLIGADRDLVDIDPLTGTITWHTDKVEYCKQNELIPIKVNESLKYSLSGDDASFFDIIENTGLISWLELPDYETPKDKNLDNKYHFTVTVKDSTGLIDTQNHTIILTDINESPEITTNDGDITAKEYEENCSTDIVDIAANDDKDSEGDGLKYTLSGEDAENFSIDPVTGKLTWNKSPDYDNPTDKNGDNVYIVVVEVTDSEGLTDTQEYEIEITNVKDIHAEIDFEKVEEENKVVTFDPSEFEFEDGTSPKKIKIESLPTDGVLKLNGVVVTEGMIIDFEDLGDLTFTPDHNWFGDTSFSWTGSDGTDWSDSTGDVDIEITTFDHDHDGILDEVELNGNIDTDNDGIPDYKDEDSDGDNIPDIEEGLIDTDKDGIPDYRDADSDGDGLTDLDEQELSKLFIPEAFSPNGDDMNDRFEIIGIEKYDNKVTIYNRWGNLIFQAENYANLTNDWDGTPSTSITLGSGKLPEGTYFYVIKIKDIKTPLRGTIYLKY